MAYIIDGNVPINYLKLQKELAKAGCKFELFDQTEDYTIYAIFPPSQNGYRLLDYHHYWYLTDGLGLVNWRAWRWDKAVLKQILSRCIVSVDCTAVNELEGGWAISPINGDWRHPQIFRADEN